MNNQINPKPELLNGLEEQNERIRENMAEALKSGDYYDLENAFEDRDPLEFL